MLRLLIMGVIKRPFVLRIQLQIHTYAVLLHYVTPFQHQVLFHVIKVDSALTFLCLKVVQRVRQFPLYNLEKDTYVLRGA